MTSTSRVLGNPIWLCGLLVIGVISWARVASTADRGDRPTIAGHSRSCSSCRAAFEFNHAKLAKTTSIPARGPLGITNE
jgi:hypothetical protein